MSADRKNVALVTGASGALGRAICLRLAREGYFVLGQYGSRRDEAESLLGSIRSSGGEGEMVCFDVRNSAQVDQVVGDWFKAHESCDFSLLVNNAGIHRDNLAGMMSDDAFDDVMRVNAFGAFYLMRFATRRMLRQRSGVILNVASLAGQAGNPGQINYAASKAALIAMTRTLAMELGARGIRVNAVAPGFIQSEMIESVPGLADMVARVPLRRVGTAEEVAGCVAFLASKDAGYITGHTLSVNGGLYPT